MVSTDALGCSIHGPGVGDTSVLKYLSILAWLQALLWVAFLILPFSGKLNPGTGKILYKKSHELWQVRLPDCHLPPSRAFLDLL